MIGLFEAVWVCDLVSFLSFPRSADLQFSDIHLVWNGLLAVLWSAYGHWKMFSCDPIAFERL